MTTYLPDPLLASLLDVMTREQLSRLAELVERIRQDTGYGEVRLCFEGQVMYYECAVSEKAGKLPESKTPAG
jgi:hypothetical protein